jgi:hypothetical protein
MFAASKTAVVSGAGPDAQFNYVTMLLHGDGTNGAQNNTFVDSSSNGFSITRNGNTTQGSFSPYGDNWSNYFGGADYISAPNNTALQIGSSDFTIECWYYNTVAAGDVLWSKAANSSAFTGYYLNIQGGARTPNFYATANGSSWAVNLSSSILMTINQWNHVAVTRNGSTWTIWVNGVSGGTATVSATILDDGSPFVVGALANNTSNITGYVSNLRFVKGTALYTSAFTPSTTPLTAVSGTSLLTCQSNRYIDNSTNAFAITVNGTPSVQRFNPFGTATAYSTATIGGSGYFDGTGDYLSTPANSANLGTGDFSITFWLYCTVDPVNSVVATNVYNSAAFTDGWYIQCGDKTVISFGIGSAGGADGVSSPSGIDLTNQWNYIEATRSGSTVRVFVNGVSGTTKTITKTGTKSGNDTKIGSRYDGSAVYLPGYITDFKVVIGTAGNTSNYTPPTAPASATGSNLLLSMQNAGIFDNAMMNDLETVGNAQISTSVVKFGTGSLAFDGSGDYVQVPSSPINTNWAGNWTIEFWLYASASGAVYYLYKGSGLQIWGIDGTMKCSISATNNSTYFIDSDFGTISANTWTHIAVVRNGNSYDGYVNGVKTNLGTSSSSANTGTEPLRVGSYTGGYGFTGYMDELRITNGFARYTANFTPPTQAFFNTGPY